MPPRLGPVAPNRPEYPDLRRVLALARRNWLRLLVGALACAAVAALAGRGTPAYTAETTLLVGPVDGDFQELRAGGQQAQTFAELATTRPVLVAVARRLHGALDVRDLASAVTAKADPTTRLLTLAVTARTRALSAAGAQALAAELQADTAAPGALHPLRVVDPAQPPAGASSGGSKRLVVIGALAGALAVLALLVVLDACGPRILGEDDLRALGAAPALGALGGSPRRRPWRRRGAAAARVGARLVAGRLIAGGDHAPRVVLLAAADDGGGTADVALALAGALCDGRDVVLVDAASSGELSAGFGARGAIGLAEALASPPRGVPGALREALLRPEVRLAVLPRGGAQPAGAVDRRAARWLLMYLRRSGALVIIAAAGLDDAPCPLGWASLADAVVAVARGGRTRAGELAGSVAELGAAGVPVATLLAAPRARLRAPWWRRLPAAGAAALRRPVRGGADATATAAG